MKKKNGFTVIELLFVVIVIGAASIIFFIQKNNIEVVSRDDAKKTAINAMYYSLEEVFFKENGYYPQIISSDNLKSVDPDLFVDPDGKKLGESGSSYSYIPTNCENDKCKKYTLRADLTREADYEKTSRN